MTVDVEKWTIKYISSSFVVETAYRRPRVKNPLRLLWLGSHAYRGMRYQDKALDITIGVREADPNDRDFPETDIHRIQEQHSERMIRIVPYDFSITHACFLIEAWMVYVSPFDFNSKPDLQYFGVEYAGDPETIATTLCMAYFGALKVG